VAEGPPVTVTLTYTPTREAVERISRQMQEHIARQAFRAALQRPVSPALLMFLCGEHGRVERMHHHTGGYIGPAPKPMPAILRNGETVIPK